MTKVQIAKWGNSSGIRLPKAMLNELGLKAGDTVDVSVRNGEGVIAPERPKRITLEWIIAEMDRLGPENAPETVDWGPDTLGERIDDEYSRGDIAEENDPS